MDELVMNFLVTEGYLDAAKAFREESSVEGAYIDASDERMHIRAAVEQGNIEEAVDRVNDLDPEILEDTSLAFQLQQQQLIEYIRSGDVERALSFAQEYLAHKGESNPQILEDLEATIALIAFQEPARSPGSHLLDASQRRRAASALNAAILKKQERDAEPRLVSVLKLFRWIGNILDKAQQCKDEPLDRAVRGFDRGTDT